MSAKAGRRVLFESPVLHRWLTIDEIKRSIVLLEAQAEAVERSGLRLHLDVVVNSIRFRRKSLKGRADGYVGCTGICIEVAATEGHIDDCTPSEKLDVTYKGTLRLEQGSTVEIAPKLMVGNAVVELGKLSLGEGQETVFERSFKGQERTLSMTDFGKLVRWEAEQPRIRRVMSDFMTGNLYVYAVSRWGADKDRRGTIAVRPSSVGYFNADREPLGSAGTLLARFLLRKQVGKIENLDGLETVYTLED